MNWQETLAYIESPRLDAELNFASGTSAFFRRVGKEPVVQEALRLMDDSGEVKEEVLGRMYDLAMAETDPDYQNPNDTLLAVLLWLTYYTHLDYARVGAQYVERAPRCFYANKLAHRIMNPVTAMSSESWAQPDTVNRVNFHSSSKAENVNVFSLASKFRVTGVPSITVPSGGSLQTGQHLIDRNVDPGVGHTEPESASSDSTAASGDYRLSIESWSPVYYRAPQKE